MMAEQNAFLWGRCSHLWLVNGPPEKGIMPGTKTIPFCLRWGGAQLAPWHGLQSAFDSAETVERESLMPSVFEWSPAFSET